MDTAVLPFAANANANYWLPFMIDFVFASVYGLTLVLSMVGWGTVCSRLFLPEIAADWGWRAAWGLSFTLCLGGPLNLFRAISAPVLICLVCLGLLLPFLLRQTAAQTGDHPYRLFQPWWPAFGVAFFLLVIRYLGSVSVPEQASYPFEFNLADDLPGYMVFPEKMLQTGSLGFDPFSWRRLSSSLGGQSFLQAIVRAVLPASSLHIADAGLGCLIAAGVLAGYLRSLLLTRVLAASLLIVFALYPPPLVNTSSLVVPVALFISLFRLWASKSWLASNSKRKLILPAMHIAALCSLKTSLMPALFIFAAVTYALRLLTSSSRMRVVSDSCWITLGSCFLVAPWMIEMYRSTGTLLYPILGSGYARFGNPGLLSAQASLTGFHALLVHAVSLPLGPFLALAILLVLVAPRFSFKQPDAPALAGLIAGSLFGAVAVLATAAGSSSVYRYLFPSMAAAIFVVLAWVLAHSPLNTLRARLAVALAIICLLGPSSMQIWRTYHAAVSNVVWTIVGRQLALPVAKARYSALQQAIPPDLPILTRLESPYLLNFKRNQIYLLDYPGWSALPPGLPFYDGGSALRDYLNSLGIRFVAYEYAMEAEQTSARLLRSVAGRPGASPVAVESLSLAVALNADLNEIGQSYERVFDDGRAFVVDLARPE